jgi:hypothetical protein
MQHSSVEICLQNFVLIQRFVVGIATKLRAGRSGFYVSILGGGWEFFSSPPPP